ICFVPDGDYARVITKLRPYAVQPGNVVHLDGRVLGKHEGIINFTIGQRRGLGVATGEPVYVISLNPATCEVVVGPHEALATREIRLKNLNWIGPLPSNAEGMDVFAKIRSTRPAAPATIHLDKDHPDQARVVMHVDDFGVSPGQACVLYEGAHSGARVFGGGWIYSTAREPSRTQSKTTLYRA
ncbi:MAG: tRNA methyl transferase PRC-barrel domain-containing protein, partial [Hyphomicrobiales bacterium]